ncbi:MAG: ABC transporter permease [Tannerellaceae bacterium]|nr:ABC transporter permease [Tannerellaceae bacterium]
MLKQYFKQAWNLLRANPLVSSISVAGTALAIAMVMVSVFILQIQLVGYPPESNRNRMLYIPSCHVSSTSEENRHSNSSGMSAEILKQVFYSLSIPEAVTGMFSASGPVSLHGKRLFKEYSVRAVDHNFWKVFDLSFITGTPFSEADFESGVRRAVISRSTARDLFDTEEAVGRTFIYQFLEYTVAGVVQDVSPLTENAYAQLWIPYTTTKDFEVNRAVYEGMSGSFRAVILAKNKNDFDKIREEIQQVTNVYNSTKTSYAVSYLNAPLSHQDVVMGTTSYDRVSWKKYLVDNGSLFLFLLLVPALNLTGITQASVQQRKGEIGIRKSFGATYKVLITQIISENFLISLIGGMIGLILSVGLLYLNRSFLLNTNASIQGNMLFHPLVFLAALFFTMLLNIMSSSIPAIRIARLSIVDAMKDNE